MGNKLAAGFRVILILAILIVNYLSWPAAVAAPNDTYLGNQWYLTKIKAPSAWSYVKESPAAVIAIIDSGVQIDHPELKNNIWVNSREIAANGKDDDKNGYVDDVNGWDFVNNQPDPRPKFSVGFTEAGITHGTVIAGIIAAEGNNAAGIAGITWRAKIMPLKALDDKLEGLAANVVKAIDYAIANGADIINLSFASFGNSKNLNEAIGRAYSRGLIVAAAAGNEKDTSSYSLDQRPMYPVCYDGPNGENRVIGVAATDAMDQKADFSSYGYKCIDISAPGVSIYGATVYSPEHSVDSQPFDKYYDGWRSGTSFSVPMVSGALALIEAANPDLSRARVIKILLDTADNINRLNPDYLNQLGRGRVSALAAVNAAAGELADKKTRLIISPQAKRLSLIKITDQDGNKDREFYAYDKNFQSGVSLASCDINGDGAAEIITGAGPGAGPDVKIFKLNGEQIGQFSAYRHDFRGGVNVACAKADNDKQAEIITAPASGLEPVVKIFDARLNLKKSFYAYDKKFLGGVNLTAGDLDGNGSTRIITGAGDSGGPQVRIFRTDGRPQSQFFAYDKNLRHGVRVAAANIRGGTSIDRSAIITAPGKGGLPEIKIFNSRNALTGHFFAYNKNFRGGINLAGADTNNDGLAEIVTAAGPGGAPHVRVFKANGGLVGSFYAYEENYSGGVNVAAIKIAK
ncbi:MAG: S8 family peptidase [bacterium]|nr:S8 family peptidase [bacterium]